MVWPSPGRITSSFGDGRGTYFHKGIDIRTQPGTPVTAAASGWVRFSGTMRGYGKVVIVDHGRGLETRYAHNRRNLVRVGDSVEAGERIALVGDTGNATAPHVHFEVRSGGEAVDPAGFLATPVPAALP